MQKVLIIRGPLGIGKSTISKLVAKKLNGTYYSIDDILAKNKLDICDEKIGCIPESNFIRGNELLLNSIKKDLRNNISVVIDGNFYQKGALIHLLEELKEYEPKVFTLKADVKICIQRDSQRKVPHGEGAAMAVHNLVSKFDYGFIVKNEDSNIEEKVNEIISKLIQK